MTATTTLTDRYVDATMRRLPGRQRPDIEQELRTSIADAIEDRVGAGTDPGEAERAVLSELGDPARLAAGYADRPLHLVGPALYLDYMRLLTTLLATVVPAVAGFVGLMRALSGDGTAAGIAAATASAAVTTAAHVAFWTTLLFAIIERTPAQRARLARPWTPAALPEQPGRRMRQAELVTETLLLILISTFILLSPFVSAETDASGEPIGLFSPWLWDTGAVYVFIALAVANLGVSFAKYHVRWSVARALTGALVNIAGALVLVWLAAGDRILNPEFAGAAGWTPDVQRWVNIGLVIAGVVTIVHAVTESVGLARRR
ncbi:permease prefix domain 1-containing protein [Dactylosporangium sp. NPDC048998]|uniref:permease prefix domain 1-containing protein n=1 Tax=Dactylosporangium sp. NPDC048998 TaxID=3363976 RepID=UPI003717E1C4